MPLIWKKIYEDLEKSWRDNQCKGAPPPVPLILNGWVYSTNKQKMERWDQTLKWAKENGFSHLIPIFSSQDSYEVDEQTNW